jgi:hypothetical protein
MDDKLCDERHKALSDTVDRHEKLLDEHGEKIDGLTIASTQNTANLDNLAKSLDGQTKAIWGLVGAVGVALLGFFIWYIQNR